jgi:cysteine desulfurase / selenocysteine lyase
MSQPRVIETPRPPFDVRRVRADFPILQRHVHGKRLVYLDNAATTQMPGCVIDRIARFSAEESSNVHRGLHYLSEQATASYEAARATVRGFLNARADREVIFVRGATEAINLVAHSFARPRLDAGDEVLVTTLEHHSNIVPWQRVCAERGAALRVVPINDAGELLLDAYDQLLGPRTKLLAVAHVSNALGTVTPLRRLIAMAHERRVPVVVDGAQAAAHLAVDVRDLDCDFYALSGHKLYGPGGIGVLYGKAELLEAMPPYQSGGDMISSVTFEKATYSPIPHKFEAGTPHIAGAIGLATALDYVAAIGIDVVVAHESALLAYATQRLAEIAPLRILGTAEQKASVVSFIVAGLHPHDIGTVLDREGIAIRAGHQCAQPLMQRLGLTATARASFALYNTREEVDALVAGIHSAIAVLT